MLLTRPHVGFEETGKGSGAVGRAVASFAAISSMALAEDLSSATARLLPGTFTTSAHSDDNRERPERGPDEYHRPCNRSRLATEPER